MLEKIVRRMGHDYLHASEGHAGIELAIKHKPEIILLDILMPDMDGFAVCQRLKSNPVTRDIPIVFVSAQSDADVRVKALELGGVDYITKPYDKEEMRIRIDIIFQMIKHQEDLQAQAYYDELTGLINRRRFNEVLESEIRHANNRSVPLSIIILDIDHFKNINDTYGHLGGDIILKQVAGILQDNAYSKDLVARYGGEEFVVLMPDTNCEKAEIAGERLRKIIKSTDWRISAEDFTLTVSMGVDTLDLNGTSEGSKLIQRADAALYTAKNQGRDRLVRWDHIDISEDDFITNYEEYTQTQNLLVEMSDNLKDDVAKSLCVHIQNTLGKQSADLDDCVDQVITYTKAVCEELHVSEDFINQLILATRLYNLGKISIPEDILTKKTALTPKERQVVEQLPLISIKLLEPLGIYSREMPIIRHRSEKFDGTGFPDGIKGQKIPFGSRILAVVDSFNAMTSPRPYRDPFTLEQALSELENCSQTKYDPQVVEAFTKVARQNTAQWPLTQMAVSSS